MIVYKINWKKELSSILLILAMFLVGIIFYPSFPDQIPVHWNFKGEADNFMSKNIFSALLFPIITLAIWLLLLFVPLLDSKKENYAQFDNAYRGIRLSFIVLFFYIYIVILAKSFGCSIAIEKAVPAGISVFIIFLGNLISKIRQNNFVGIRLPWTLANQDVWDKTHRLAGKLLMAAGLLGLLGTLLPPVWTAIIFFGGISLAFITAGIYSYVIFNKSKIQH